MRSEKAHNYAFHPVSQRFPNVAFQTVPMFVWLTMALCRPFKDEDRLALLLSTPLLQAIDGVMSFALCSQHFRSSETQATCDGCFTRKSVGSVISLHSGMSTGLSKVDVDHWHIPVWASHSTVHFFFFLFCNKVIKSVMLSVGKALTALIWPAPDVERKTQESESGFGMLAAKLSNRETERRLSCPHTPL